MNRNTDRRHVLKTLATLALVAATPRPSAAQQQNKCGVWNPLTGGYNSDGDCTPTTGAEVGDADCGLAYQNEYNGVHGDSDCTSGGNGPVAAEGKDADCGLKQPGASGVRHEDSDCGTPTSKFETMDADCGKQDEREGTYSDGDCANNSAPNLYNADNDCTMPGGGDLDCELFTMNGGQLVVHNDGNDGTTNP